MNRFTVSALALLAGVAAAQWAGPDLAGMDHSTSPGDDFFQFANGGWLKATDIPEDRSSYGTSAMLAELTTRRVNELLVQTTTQSSAPGSETQQIGDYYLSFVDEATIEKKGLTPLRPALARIEAIANRHQLAAALGAGLRTDVDVLNSTNFHTPNLFGLWVAQDLDDPNRYSPFLLQGGLEMPDREYYVNPSPAMAAIRQKYQAHVAAMLELAGFTEAKARAARVLELERRMAEVHWTRAASEQVSAGNNHWTRAQFDAQAPGLDWQRYLTAAGLDRQKDFVVWQPRALVGLSQLTRSESLDTWKDYLRFHAVQDAAPYLAKRFDDESFAFNGRVLYDTPEQRPRWKRAVDSADNALGDAVGKLYVQRYFSPAEKTRAEAMVRNLLTAYATRIDRLEWMAPATKAIAKEKLAALKVGVGYPDHWRSYTGLKIVRGDALGNHERAEAFDYRKNLAKLSQPVDRSEWVMNAQLVNAVNLPALNALNFPAAILQPPYFDPKQPLVMDYGATGATIGHEISHSFDDQGALFDAHGRLNNWWQPDDFAHFRASGALLAAQYSTYKPFPDLAVNGEQTLSENIADVAGLNAAYDAYRLATQGAEPVTAAGFSSDELFFLSFGQSWREKTRAAALRNQIITDGHAPAQYRAQTVRNLDAWYAAFTVNPGQALYLSPEQRVRVW